MLDMKFVRENLTEVQEALARRGSPLDLQEFVACDQERRRILREGEALKHQRNQVSERIAALKKAGRSAEAEIAAMREVSDRITHLDEEAGRCDERLRRFLLTLPNIPHPTVPLGRGSDDNPEIRRWGEPRRFDFEPRPHWEIGEELGILDLARATKMSGARFPLLVGLGALLERALINFMLDLHTTVHGYREVWPPLLVQGHALEGTGQLPKLEGDLFKTADERFYLVPTAEVPLTNLHREEVLPPGGLPISYVAYTPCFRREAGSYGKDVRGLIRQHQFDKVELVKFTEPDQSDAALEMLTSHAEEVLRRLHLPYRVVLLCTADLGFAAAKTYDIEVWLPSQGGAYREISSCSNCRDFQARRAGIRYRPTSRAAAEYAHTLNGSGLAVGRTWVAILENYQEKDGSVTIPEALRSYMGGRERITAKGA